jgi:DNA repair exonuclease SbcCD nuclease subunit
MSTIKILCPECKAEITVDRETGVVLMHEKSNVPVEKATFEERLQALDKGKQKAEELFSKEVQALKDKDRLLEERFQEAMKKAKEKKDEPDKRPLKDIDL